MAACLFGLLVEKRAGLKEKLDLLSERLARCEMFASDSGSVSMAVIGRDHDRVQRALAHLKCWLGRTVPKRVVEPPAAES